MADATTIRQIAERHVELLARRPDRGLLTCRTRARRVAGLRCEIEEGSWRLAADMPRKIGGEETGPTPGVLGRAALASCLVIGISAWSARLGIEVAAVEVEVETDFDARGELGMGKVEPGYSVVRCRISVDSPASRSDVDHLLAMVEQHSPYLDVFGRAVPITCSHHIRSAGA
ncbi:MAG: OsmC family protein [Geminicoccaceae bacterium]